MPDSAATILMEYVCPIAGILVGNSMFAAPWRDAWNASKRGDLGDLNPLPWSFMAGNCLGWVQYSILRNNLFIFFGNAPGFVLSIWLNLQAVKLQYAQSYYSSIIQQEQLQQHHQQQQYSSTSNASSLDGHEQDPKKIQKLAIQQQQQQQQQQSEIKTTNTKDESSSSSTPQEYWIISITLIWLAIIALTSFADVFSSRTNELIVGITVNLNLVFFYGAPLSTIYTVVTSQNSASIHIPTMLLNTANGVFWGIYGLAVLDPFVAVPNGIGAGLGVIQFFLCLTIPRKPTTVVTTTTTTTTTAIIITDETLLSNEKLQMDHPVS